MSTILKYVLLISVIPLLAFIAGIMDIKFLMIRYLLTAIWFLLLPVIMKRFAKEDSLLINSKFISKSFYKKYYNLNVGKNGAVLCTAAYLSDVLIFAYIMLDPSVASTYRHLANIIFNAMTIVNFFDIQAINKRKLKLIKK